MTTAEERLAALQATDDPPPTTPEPEPTPSTSPASTELDSQLEKLRRSIKKLSTAQNGTTDAVNALINTSTPPDHGEAIAALTKQVEVLSKEVKALASKPAPEPQAVVSDFSETQLDQLKKVVKSATEPVVAEDGRVRPVPPTADEREAAAGLKAMLDRAEALTAEVKVVAGRLSWDSAKWFKAALLGLPYAVVLVMLLALVWPVSAVFGIPALSAWAWESFGAAGSVWGRGFIAVATVAAFAAVFYAVYRGGKWLAGKYETAIK